MWKDFIQEFRTLAIWQKSLFLIVIAGFAFLFGAHQHGKATSLPPAQSCTNVITAKSVPITMNDKEVTPEDSNITVCDTIITTNAGTDYHQPALGSHSNHLDYPGYEAETAIKPGETFSIQLVHTGRFLIHDHLNESIQGFITVSKK